MRVLGTRMRLTIVIVLLCAVAAAIVGGAYVAIERARTATSPIGTYGQASAEEAKALGARLAASLVAGEGKELDEAFDLDAMVGEAILPVRLFPAQRARFITDFVTGMHEAGSGTLGAQLAKSAKGGLITVIHVHEVNGRQRAMVRFVDGAGALSYHDWVIGKDAQGRARVIDFYNYLSGQMFSEVIAGLALPAIAESTRTSLERLITGGSHDADPAAYAAVSKAFNAGKPAEAMARWQELSEAQRTSRTGMFLRMRCSQALGDAPYQQAIEAITSAFPDDASLALIEIDGFLLRKEWDRSLASIDLVDRSVGGDPYLDCTRAGVLRLAGRLDQAKAAIARYLAAEPGVQQAWWTAVDIALATKDHVETVRLLLELERRFRITFKDLATNQAYADFVASPEYARWRERPAAHAGEQGEQVPQAVVAEPAAPATAAPAP